MSPESYHYRDVVFVAGKVHAEHLVRTNSQVPRTDEQYIDNRTTYMTDQRVLRVQTRVFRHLEIARNRDFGAESRNSATKPHLPRMAARLRFEAHIVGPWRWIDLFF